MSSRVATRYAKSLIDLAKAQSIDGKVYEEMEAFKRQACCFKQSIRRFNRFDEKLCVDGSRPKT